LHALVCEFLEIFSKKTNKGGIFVFKHLLIHFEEISEGLEGISEGLEGIS
jgi:hypothetical protein